MSRMMSIGHLAKHHGDEVWRVEYVLRTRGIKPLGKLGNANIYGPAAIRQVGEALAEIRNAKRGTPEPTGQELAHA